MASVVWMSVFILLMVELGIMALLVLPMPRFITKFLARKIYAFDLGRRVRFIANFIILGLILAVSDAISTIRRLEIKDEKFETTGVDGRTGFVSASYDKQRKFRAERNVLYLAGFALTLMFAIARIVELMGQLVNAEDESDSVRKRLDAVGVEASETTTIPKTDESKAAAGNTPYQLRKRPSATAAKTE